MPQPQLPTGWTRAVEVDVLRGRNLAAKDFNGKSDPFVRVYCATSLSAPKKEWVMLGKTNVCSRNLNPAWKKKYPNIPLGQFLIHVNDKDDLESHKNDERVIVVQCWDKNVFFRNSFMGQVVIPLAEIVDGVSENWYHLNSRPRKRRDIVNGDLFIRIKFTLPRHPDDQPTNIAETTPCIGREDLLRSDPVEKVTSPVSELAVERAASSPDFIPSERRNSEGEEPSFEVDATWMINIEDLKREDKLGQGSYATVYKGKFRNKTVAIKELKAINSKSAEMEEFKKEFQIISMVHSEYIPVFYGVCMRPRIQLVFEFCQHGDLFTFLNRSPKKQPLTWEDCISICKQCCLAIEVLHTHNPPIFHRDIKSLNFLVAEGLKVKVCDFGLSRVEIDNSGTLTQLRGTYQYAAPEVYEGFPYTAKSDIYSLGVLIWEVFNRLIKSVYEAPYSEYPNLKSDFQIIISVIKKGTRPSFADNFPNSLKQLIESCWASESKQRPALHEIVADLDGILHCYNENRDEWNALIAEPPDQEEEESECSDEEFYDEELGI